MIFETVAYAWHKGRLFLPGIDVDIVFRTALSGSWSETRASCYFCRHIFTGPEGDDPSRGIGGPGGSKSSLGNGMYDTVSFSYDLASLAALGVSTFNSIFITTSLLDSMRSLTRTAAAGGENYTTVILPTFKFNVILRPGDYKASLSNLLVHSLVASRV